MKRERETAVPEEGSGTWRDDVPERVSAVLSDALEMGATDVHVDPVGSNAYRVRYRVDGAIHPKAEISKAEGQHLVNEIKVAAQFTPDRAFTALENRFTLDTDEGPREVRVTVLPTAKREAAHLRVLSPPSEVLRPTELGLSEAHLSLIRRTLRRPEGLILISGPTGAGKTMTLYSLASFLDLETVIAVSVEDPVEYDLRYVRQVQADPERGLSMPAAVKAVLRMDPDIILVGEIRDAQSAITAVRAAASGRFVLATTHATDAVLAVEACLYSSVPRHLLGSALRLVISQALVRSVCGHCAEPRELSGEERELFQAEGLAPPSCVPSAQGCEACHHFGYRGRTGLFQVVALDREMAVAVSGTHGAEALRSRIAQRGLPSLLQDGLTKVASGVTTMEEVRSLHVPGESEKGDPD